MARAIWKGAITFGLVSIPVELHAAEDKRESKFALIDKRDFSPVGYRRYSKSSGKEVPWDDVVKGYEYEKGEYVVLSDEDFRRANAKASQAVEIQAFVPAAEIPAEFFETPYYLVPTRAGQKVYALLRETLRDSKRIAIGQVVIRTVPHLAAVVPVGRALMLNTMRYPEELRNAEGLSLPAQGLGGMRVSAKESELAKRLVDDMAEHWKPAEFKNTYHDDLMRRIREKIDAGETREITPSEKEQPAPRRAKVIDLAALLQRSLKQGERPGRKGPHRAGRATTGETSSKSTGSVRGRRSSARRKHAA